MNTLLFALAEYAPLPRPVRMALATAAFRRMGRTKLAGVLAFRTNAAAAKAVSALSRKLS